MLLSTDYTFIRVIFRFNIPVVFYENEGGWVRLNTTVVGSYLMDKR